jgi:hypothetical protein
MKFLKVNSRKGFLLFYVIVFVVVTYVALNTLLAYNINQVKTFLSLTGFKQDGVERDNLESLVKQAVLSGAEVVAVPSASALSGKISTRLSTWLGQEAAGQLVLGSVTGGSSLVWTPSNAWLNPPDLLAAGGFSGGTYFFPYSNVPALSSFNTADFELGGNFVGIGQKTMSWLSSGVYSYLGSLTAKFSRFSSLGTGTVRRNTITCKLFSVPVTNFNLILYGLPSLKQSYPESAPSWSGFSFADDMRPFIVTGNKLLNDSTLLPAASGDFSLIISSESYERVPFNAYRDEISLGFNFYDYLFNSPDSPGSYQAALNSRAKQLDGVFLDYSQPNGGLTSSPVYLTQVSETSGIPKIVTLDLSKIPASISLLEFFDVLGNKELVILGASALSAVNLSPIYVYVNNATVGVPTTKVTLQGDNHRPVIILGNRMTLSFQSVSLWTGALFLGPDGGFSTSTWPLSASGSPVQWFGHVSLFHAYNGLGGVKNFFGSTGPVMLKPFPPNMAESLATLAPRVLFVSSRGDRN